MMKIRSTNREGTVLKCFQKTKKVVFSPIIQTSFDPKEWLNKFQQKTTISGSQKSIKSQFLLKDLREKQKKSKSSILAQLKCLMSLNMNNQKFFMNKFLIKKAITKILQHQKSKYIYSIRQSNFLKMSHKIISKFPDSHSVLQSFEACFNSQTYPPTVQFMLTYLGVFLYCINGNYQGAEQYFRFKTEEYFIIYLIMQIRLKTNLCEWQKGVNYLSKLISFAWLYNLTDLQIWCYFQFSRALFFLQQKAKSQIFRNKSQMNYIQPKDSIYRQLRLSKLKYQIQQIWQGKLQFQYEDIIDQTRLALPPKQIFHPHAFIKDQRKLKSNIKKIITQCKIRHVPQLLSRISQTNQVKTPLITTPFFNRKQISGNNFFLTHKSRNKNMKVYFRSRQKKQKPTHNIYYTIQNSQKNWNILKQMLKCIQAEIDYTFSNK